MPAPTQAPGLIQRKRSDGSQVAYWVARRDIVKAGYRPKTVRLHYAADDPMLVARCHILQAEMLTWASDNRLGRPSQYDGTFASLVRVYETDQDSPYFELKSTTQVTYSKTMKSLMKHKGTRRIDSVTASDVRRWYKELTEAVSKAWAYYTINVLKSVLSYGATKRITECTMLRAELREARFHAPSRRKERITHAQINAFCASARALKHEWMARLLRLQFDFGLRRIDLIGEYVRDVTASAGIRIGNRVWQGGSTWAHIDDRGIYRKLISKTQFTSGLIAVHAVADYPDVEIELARTPLDRRVGPLVINERTGLPPTDAQCRRYFRVIARAAGIPDEVWNMDTRAGADTEAYEAGATEEETMALLTHTEAKTSRGYLRDLTEQSHRAAKKRVASRKE